MGRFRLEHATPQRAPAARKRGGVHLLLSRLDTHVRAADARPARLALSAPSPDGPGRPLVEWSRLGDAMDKPFEAVPPWQRVILRGMFVS